MFKRTALNFELPAPDAADQAAPPEWLLLVPPGAIVGRDGRAWTNDQPAEAIAYNRQLRRDIVVDVEHASELKAPKGDPAPAAGWVDTASLEIRDGAIWGRVSWTDGGRNLVLNREYRYYSPAFLYDAQGRVRGLASVGLTNKHNLDLPALNQQQESSMIPIAILSALSLPEDADEAAVLAAIRKVKDEHQVATNRALQPSLDKFVPRAEYDAVASKRDELQTALNQQAQQKRDAEITTLVDEAIKAGQVTPATREFYLATCRQDGGVEEFKKFLAVQPKAVGDSDLGERSHDKNKSVALNAEQKQVADAFGNSAEDIAKYGAI